MLSDIERRPMRFQIRRKKTCFSPQPIVDVLIYLLMSRILKKLKRNNKK